MIGTIDCVYETPCGWCSKWNKKCDRKLPGRGQRIRINPVNDDINDTSEMITNKICEKKSDHKWEICGISTKEALLICSKCGAYKSIPIESV